MVVCNKASHWSVYIFHPSFKLVKSDININIRSLQWKNLIPVWKLQSVILHDEDQRTVQTTSEEKVFERQKIEPDIPV